MADRSVPRRLGALVPTFRAGRITLIAVAAIVALLLPFAVRPLGQVSGFLALVLSIVLLLDAVSCYLLISRFADTGDVRIFVTALAYLWSSVLVISYAFSFPGLVQLHPLLGHWHSAAPWLYLGWHVGFPAILAAAWGPWPRRWLTYLPPERRRRTTGTCVAAVVAAAAVAVAIVVVVGPHFLPVLIVGTNTTRLTVIGGPPSMVISVASAVLVTRGLRGRSGPERWVAIAAWVCVADLLLTFASRHRFSVGWYGGRTLTMVAASLVCIAMFHEFTALQRRLIGGQEQLSRQARTDQLTGLANRFALHDVLISSMGPDSDDVLLLADLDRFKIVNDSLGHETGDAVIAETGRRLTETNGSRDFIARLGGDEFALVLRGPLTDGEAAVRCERVPHAIRQPYKLTVAGSVTQSFLGASLGLTRLCGLHAPGEAMREADLALYRAKENGRDRFEVFDESLRREALGRLELERVIRSGLARARFGPYLQPIVALADNSILGYEILMRLRDDDGAEVLPSGLIDVAEESGLITELDTLMLHTAARLLNDPGGVVGLLNVNVSARTMLHPGFADTITKVALEAGAARCRMGVEITERILLQNDDSAVTAIDALHSLGIRVGLDNFGTGYSSLSYLRRFDLDFIKIDRSFIAELAADEVSASRVLRVFFEIGAAFDFDVIAEGVDSLAEARMLAALGCKSAQGYALGHPGPLDRYLPDLPATSPCDADEDPARGLVTVPDRRTNRLAGGLPASDGDLPMPHS
jgi:diguanylate cyclase (GGDEF)-like protein